MLTAKVGYTRTVGSNSYTAVLDGDIPATLDDPEAVLAKIGELFALAEEALQMEIERNLVPGPTAPPAQAPRDGPAEPITAKQVQYLQTLTKKAGAASSPRRSPRPPSRTSSGSR